MEYGGFSLSGQCTWEPYDRGFPYRCPSRNKRTTTVSMSASTAMVYSVNAVIDAGGYSNHWLKRLNRQLANKPYCGGAGVGEGVIGNVTACMDENGIWHGRCTNGFGMPLQPGSNTIYKTFDNGMSMERGGFGDYNVQSGLGARGTANCIRINCPSGVTCVCTGDVNFREDSLHSFPGTYNWRKVNAQCRSLGGGKTAWSVNVGIFAEKRHNKKLAHHVNTPCCDFNHCECKGEGCGTPHGNYHACLVKQGGFQQPCSHDEPCDWACRADCNWWDEDSEGMADVSVCYESPSSQECWKHRCRCLADPERRGNYKGCCDGGNEGGTTSGSTSLSCQAFEDRYGRLAGTMCPQDMVANYYCYGWAGGCEGTGPVVDDRQIAPHPDCPDTVGSIWTHCTVPGVSHGSLGKSLGFSVNQPGLQDEDVPWCRGCTAQEYFDMFDSRDFRVVTSTGKEIQMDISIR